MSNMEKCEKSMSYLIPFSIKRVDRRPTNNMRKQQNEHCLKIFLLTANVTKIGENSRLRSLHYFVNDPSPVCIQQASYYSRLSRIAEKPAQAYRCCRLRIKTLLQNQKTGIPSVTFNPCCCFYLKSKVTCPIFQKSAKNLQKFI